MIRPMREQDADAVLALAVTTFEALTREQGGTSPPPPDPDVIRPRHANMARSDRGGCWVAEEDGALVGCAMSILREGIWGLSLFIVHPERQSQGVGRELLRRAHEYGDGARGRIVLSSRDPRALRAYLGLGLAPQPAVKACGTPRGVAVPAGVHEGSEADLPFIDAVSRHVRTAAHAPDMHTYFEMGATVLVAEERGFAVVLDGELRLLAGLHDAGAQDVLGAALARLEGQEITVDWITERQAWALPVCLEAGLEPRTDAGPVFTSGDVGPFTPYLPSGSFL